MEPEVHIIEKYFQEILHCFTMTNIRCESGNEIDLLAVNPRTGEKYHIEARVGTSPSSKIRLHDTYAKNGRPHKIGIDYFVEKKFDHPIVKEKVKQIFNPEDYKRVLVVWDVFDLSLLPWCHANFNLDIWFMDDILSELVKKRVLKGSRDDVLRTIELLTLSQKVTKRRSRASDRKIARKTFTPDKIEELGKGMLKFKKKIDEARQLERHSHIRE